MPRRLTAVLLASLLLATAAVHARQDDPRLDPLFAELQALDKRRDDRAAELQARIWRLWYAHDDERVRSAMQRGLDALTRRRHEAAEAAFTAALRLDPGYAEAWNRRGTTRYLLGRYEAALEDIERVIELEPRHFGALAGRGLCLRALDRPRAALRALESALEVNPHMDRVYIETLRLRARLAEETAGRADPLPAAGRVLTGVGRR